MFLNSNGHGQALQFVMQGYSDSIKTKSSNQGSAMANAFNQGLSNAVQTHDNHEQALQNREATRLQNEYMNKTMQDRVRHQAQQTEANDLANDYTRRTLDDRIKHEGQRTTMNALEIQGKRLNNDYQAIKNEIANKTKGTEIDKMNWANKDSVSSSKLSEQKHGILLENYIGSTPVRQVGNKYQQLVSRKDSAGNTHQEWQDIDEATYNRQIEINSNINKNRRTLGKTDTTANEMTVAQQQAQQANAEVNKEMLNAQHAAIKETQKLLAGFSKNEIVGLINEAAREGQSYITIEGNNIDLSLAKQATGYGLGAANGGHIGTGVNINNNMTYKQQVADAIGILRNPDATEQQKANARNTLATEKDIKDLYKKIGAYALAGQQMEKIAEQDRLKTFVGFLGQYVGGDNAKQYGELSAAQSNILTSLGTSALKGTLSNMDMRIIRQQVSNLRKSGAFNEGVLVAALDKMIKDIEYSTENFGGVEVLTPKAQTQYYSFVKLRQALMER